VGDTVPPLASNVTVYFAVSSYSTIKPVNVFISKIFATFHFALPSFKITA
jgi:hypothetical protein